MKRLKCIWQFVAPPAYAALVVILAMTCSTVPAQQLQMQLERESPTALAKAAWSEGDAQRGAILFYQPYIACSKCHLVGDASSSTLNPLGPNLAQTGSYEQPPSDAELVESVLFPSKAIRAGYEGAAVITSDGESVVGLLVDASNETVSLRLPQGTAELTTFQSDEIEAWKRLDTSIMPTGQVDQLASRQQFLDLIRYLMEIRDGGAARAGALQPDASLLAFRVPEYEQNLDHAGLIATWDDDAYQRGEAIYQRVCANCHGTHDKLGSLPTSLRFAEGKFKNGSDPYSMYRTLTHGFGLMTPQTWMVPSQKYDVIHYIRESYLRPHNTSHLVDVDADYLARLPKGETRGPEPSQIVAWSAMDYGPSLTHTYEVPGSDHNFAYKGIAIRLDPGAGGVSRGRQWMMFDTDTLRMAAGWTGSGFQEDNFIDWQGIQFDGKHGVHPRLVGQIAFSNATGPGWAEPVKDSFDDEQRVLGRDGKRYGPLPREWGQFHGQYFHGQQIALSYSIGTTSVLESPSLLLRDAQSPVFLRTLNLGPRKQDLVLHVAEFPAAAAQLKPVGFSTAAVLLDAADASQEANVKDFAFDGQTYLQVNETDDFDLTNQDFTIQAKVRTHKDGTIWALTQEGPKWVPNGQTFFIRGGRLCFDIGWVGALRGQSPVADGKWHDVAATWNSTDGLLSLYVDGQLDGSGKLSASGALESAVVRIGYTSPNFPNPASFFEGDLREVKFIQALVAPGQSTRSAPVTGHWKLNVPAATRISDASARGNDAEVRRVGDMASSNGTMVAGFAPSNLALRWEERERKLCLRIPAGPQPLRFTLWISSDSTRTELDQFASLRIPNSDGDLTELTRGGPPRWPQTIQTTMTRGTDNGPLAVDVLVSPDSNPWLAQTRLTGLDFFADGSLAICTWDGDVWHLTEAGTVLNWRRIASGLFQPLGLKIVNEKIHVTCRDQLAVLHDLNHDGEIDYYQCLNNDHQVTEHFHEFAMGLQVDEAGNFYYAKSGQHGKPAVVPHHGTLLQVSANGSSTKILANGFRAANGVCLNPDGSFVVTDQEGFWNPKNRINWVTLNPNGRPKFYGNMLGYHDVIDESDAAMEPPLCWITNAFDRSPGELLWVESPSWGPLNGRLLNLSYGYGKVFLVPHEEVDGLMQGGMIELPIDNFPTGVMRGRFHPRDGHLFACGMFAWAGNATQPGGLYRLRATGRPMHLPVELHANRSGIQLVFSEALDNELISAERFRIETWSLKRTAKYGSDHYDTRELSIASAELAADGKTIDLKIPDIQPTWCMSIEYKIRAANGQAIAGTIHNTIHRLAD
ncbi:MAG: DUF6797 domain-containing protein [Pirellulaceae bacterium]